MDEKGNQWEPEILIIPLHSTSETPESPASREDESPQTQSLEENELVPEPSGSKARTSLTNGEPVSSIKQLQSLFEREKTPQPTPVAPHKRTPTSPPNGEHTTSLKQLQSLFEKEQRPQPVPLTSGRKTSTSSLKVEHSNALKDEGTPVHPPTPVTPGTKTTTSPQKPEPTIILIENKEPVTSSSKTPTTPPQVELSTTLKEEGEAILLSTPVTSGTKTTTSSQKAEPSIILIENKEPVLPPTPVPSGNKTTTAPLQVDHANTIKQLQSLFEREGRAQPQHVTSNSTSPASSLHEEVNASAKDEEGRIQQPLSAMSNDKTSTPMVNGESAGPLKEPNSPPASPLFLDCPRSPLANQELILELKKGKCLRPTQQTRGLTTVFMGNSKSTQLQRQCSPSSSEPQNQ
ncbi:uncharacterized protein LOC144799053 isoform X2 [Lissotriton helveticus]